MPDSMPASSAPSGPMWRAWNSAAFSSSPRGFRADINMATILEIQQRAPRARSLRSRARSAVLDELVVGGAVHQAVELGGVGQLDLEEPAGLERVGIGQGGVGAQCL